MVKDTLTIVQITILVGAFYPDIRFAMKLNSTFSKIKYNSIVGHVNMFPYRWYSKTFIDILWWYNEYYDMVMQDHAAGATIIRNRN